MTPLSTPAPVIEAPLDVVNVVYSYLRARREASNKEKGHTGPQESFHISALGHPCVRKAVLERLGVERQPMRDASIATLDYGYLIEGLLEQAVRAWINERSNEWELLTQVRVKAPGFIGTLDWLLRHKTSGRVILLDSKSANGNSFRWKVKDGADVDYAYQLGMYAEALTMLHEPITVTHAGLLYMDKEYGHLHVVWFDVAACRAKARERSQDFTLAWNAANLAGDGHAMLPEEMPFQEIYSANNKHVQSGRAKKGEKAPHGLCSPLYCSVLNHCPKVRAWWDGKTA